MSNPKRRGIPLASRYPLCGEAEEDHHLLVHCPKIWELWGRGWGPRAAVQCRCCLGVPSFGERPFFGLEIYPDEES